MLRKLSNKKEKLDFITEFKNSKPEKSKVYTDDYYFHAEIIDKEKDKIGRYTNIYKDVLIELINNSLENDQYIFENVYGPIRKVKK